MASLPATTMPLLASLYRRSRSSLGSFLWVAPSPLVLTVSMLLVLLEADEESLTSSPKASLPSRPDSCRSLLSCFCAACTAQGWL